MRTHRPQDRARTCILAGLHKVLQPVGFDGFIIIQIDQQQRARGARMIQQRIARDRDVGLGGMNIGNGQRMTGCDRLDHIPCRGLIVIVGDGYGDWQTTRRQLLKRG